MKICDCVWFSLRNCKEEGRMRGSHSTDFHDRFQIWLKTGKLLIIRFISFWCFSALLSFVFVCRLLQVEKAQWESVRLKSWRSLVRIQAPKFLDSESVVLKLFWLAAQKTIKILPRHSTFKKTNFCQNITRMWVILGLSVLP